MQDVCTRLLGSHRWRPPRIRQAAKSNSQRVYSIRRCCAPIVPRLDRAEGRFDLGLKNAEARSKPPGLRRRNRIAARAPNEMPRRGRRPAGRGANQCQRRDRKNQQGRTSRLGFRSANLAAFSRRGNSQSGIASAGEAVVVEVVTPSIGGGQALTGHVETERRDSAASIDAIKLLLLAGRDDCAGLRQSGKARPTEQIGLASCAAHSSRDRRHISTFG